MLAFYTWKTTHIICKTTEEWKYLGSSSKYLGPSSLCCSSLRWGDSLVKSIVLVFTIGNVLQHLESLQVSAGEWSNLTCTTDCSQHHFAGDLPCPLLVSWIVHTSEVDISTRFGARKSMTVESAYKTLPANHTVGRSLKSVRSWQPANWLSMWCAAIGTHVGLFQQVHLLEVEETVWLTSLTPVLTASPSSLPYILHPLLSSPLMNMYAASQQWSVHALYGYTNNLFLS